MLLNFYCLKTLKFHYFSTSIIKKIPVVLKLETTILLIREAPLNLRKKIILHQGCNVVPLIRPLNSVL